MNDAQAQDLLGDDIGFSGATLHLRSYIDLAGLGADRRIISMTTQPANTLDPTLFVTTQSGVVYAVRDVGGTVTATAWFNYNAAVNAAVSNASNGFVLENPAGAHGGLRSIAFHPEFAANGKFYTTAMVDRPVNVPGINYLGNSTSGFDGESALVEWTFDHTMQQVDSSSYRELFRIQMPVFDHPIKQLAFNVFASPGDEDYGLLYIAHGDGSDQPANAGGGQIRDNALGKILRVNPLESGLNPYTTPNNPFVGDPTTLDEIYTLGHRNPHHISFSPDDNGNGVLILAEVGRTNIEEVNLPQPGGDYGWSDREGTFVHNRNGGPNGEGYGLGYHVSNLPENEWELNDYVYAAAQYDHDSNLGDGHVGAAIAGGFTIQNNSDPALQGQYIFADFGSNSGHAYQAGLNDLLASHTQLADGEPPSALTQATISRLRLTLDADGDGTIDVSADNFNSLLGVGRNDIRFGRGPNGEMFISSKQTGQVYLVANTEALGALKLVINVDTGETVINNTTAEGVNLKGYSLLSLSGGLNLAGWESLQNNPSFPGWDEANPTEFHLSELNSMGSSVVGVSDIPLGRPISLSVPAFGVAEYSHDVRFEYTTAEAEIVKGQVGFEGMFSVNNLLLTVDPTSGETELTNDSQTTLELRGYSILSESGSLKPGDTDWNSLADQGNTGIEEANPSANALSELVPLAANGITVTPGQTFQLGDLFDTAGDQDLELEFSFSELVSPTGDYNNDGVVNAADYTVWRDNLGGDGGLLTNRDPSNTGAIGPDDYTAWKTNFGGGAVAGDLTVFSGVVRYTSLTGSASLEGATVPEPNTAILLSQILGACAILRRIKRTGLPQLDRRWDR